jgi:hypothetical protein
MSASLNASNTFTFNDGNAGHVINLGSAPSVGQWDILCVNSDTTVSTPSGFTSSTPEVGGQGAYMFRRLAVGGEASTVTVTTAGNFDTEVGWTRWDNVNAADQANSVQASSSNTTSPSVTTGTMAETNELVIAFSANHNFPGSPPASPNWTTGAAGYTNALTMSIGAVGGFVGYSTTAGTAAEIPVVTWTNAAVDRYMLLLTFTTLTPSGVNPDSVTGTGALGDPTLDGTLAIVPDSVTGAGALGAPTVDGTLIIIPDSVTGTGVLGDPTVSDTSGLVAPDSVTGAGALGDPALNLATATISPDSVLGAGNLGAPTVEPLDEGGDTLLLPYAQSLLSCLCAALSEQANPPEICCLRAGDEIIQDFGQEFDECCNGQAYVRVVSFAPTGNPEAMFPAPSTDNAVTGCGVPAWALNLEMGVFRCIDTDHQLSCTDWTNVAIQQMADAKAIRVALCCWLAELEPMSVQIKDWTPKGPEGGCIGGIMNVAVEVVNCDCD